MTMGEMIRNCRTLKGWTQEELGKALEPVVNRAAINKWETGQVENIKRCHIQQMSKIFNIDPCDLMCFTDTLESEKILKMIQDNFGKDAGQMLNLYLNLNDTGKEKAIQNITDLNEIPRYTEKKKDSQLLNA